MRIDLTSLLAGNAQEVPFEGVLESEMGYIFEHLRPDKVYPIQCKGRLFKTGSRLMLECAYQGQVKVPCDRCLELFEYPFAGEISLELRKGNKEMMDEGSEEEENEIFYYQTAQLNLAEVVAIEIVLNLPIQVVCRQDCNGLCPTCGQNLNEGSCSCDNQKVDPRMASLKDLLKHM